MGLVVNLLAAAAALYDAKLLVWDIALDDLRKGSGGWLEVVLALAVSLAFVALPLVVGLRLAAAGRTVASLLVGMASLVLSAIGVFILATAFTP